MDNTQYTQLLIIALLAAKHAGGAILEVYNSDFAVEQKEDKSPLTLADKRSHKIIINDLEKPIDLKNPALPILSEEGKDIPYDERKSWEYFWLVDPLDGTREFVKRNGEFTVNIALIYKNKPVLGIIYVPVKDTCYFAALDLGTYKLVGTEIVTDKLSVKELLDKSQRLPIGTNGKEASFLTIIGSRSHATKELSKFIEHMKENYGEIAIISAGSSLKICLVAEGKADVYPRFGPTMEWDTAAGQAIVEQAKGKVMDIRTKEPLYYNKQNLVNPFFIVCGQSSLLE